MAIARAALVAAALSTAAHAQVPASRTTPVSLEGKTLTGLDEFVPTPDDNPLTPAKVALGRRLFFDSMLSIDRRLSCASCHHPDRAFADTVPRSHGVNGQSTKRNAPTIVNRAYGRLFFWDGRANSLEAQVVMPISEPSEMGLPLAKAITRLSNRTDYRAAFAAAFDDQPNAINLARALASYVRTIRSGDAPIDRYRAGDSAALTPEARYGMELFAGRANCSTCHTGNTFTDEQTHNTGVAVGTPDLGRFAITGHPADRGAFKTPTLRNVALTAPYMHDGSFATLEQVIEFYNRGGRHSTSLDPEIHPLELTMEERNALLAFLRSLTGIVVADSTAELRSPVPRL